MWRVWWGLTLPSPMLVRTHLTPSLLRWGGGAVLGKCEADQEPSKAVSPYVSTHEADKEAPTLSPGKSGADKKSQALPVATSSQPHLSEADDKEHLHPPSRGGGG